MIGDTGSRLYFGVFLKVPRFEEVQRETGIACGNVRILDDHLSQSPRERRSGLKDDALNLDIPRIGSRDCSQALRRAVQLYQRDATHPSVAGVIQNDLLQSAPANASPLLTPGQDRINDLRVS